MATCCRRFQQFRPSGGRDTLGKTLAFTVILGNLPLCQKTRPFDSSGSGPIHGMKFRSVSPHPDPLPKGEGTAGSEQWKADQRVWILRGEWFTLSPRERAGVRGKQPGHAAARMASPWRAANARRAGWL